MIIFSYIFCFNHETMGWLLTSNQAELCRIRHYPWQENIFFVAWSYSVTFALRCSYWNEIPTTLLRTETHMTLHYPVRRHGSLACYLGSFLFVFHPWIVFLSHLKFYETRNIYIVHLFQNLQILFCCHTPWGNHVSLFGYPHCHIYIR
jgi:hypothetical protein